MMRILWDSTLKVIIEGMTQTKTYSDITQQHNTSFRLILH